MAHNVYIRGLSDAGFRTPAAGGGYAFVKGSGNTQVDIDDVKTQLKLAGERDNFIRVSGSGATTAVIVGTSRRGFRIPRSSDGAYVMVKLGGGAVTVDLTKGKVRQILRRSKRDWIAAADATSVAVRGIQHQQNGFELRAKEVATLTGSNSGNATNGKTVTIGSKTYTIKTNLTEVRATATLTSDNTDVADGDTVTIHDKTYRFKDTIAQVNDIHRTGTADTTLTNLVNAINGAGTAGTDYFTGTTGPTGVTAGAVASHATVLTAAVGSGVAANSWVTTTTATHISFGAGVFGGGVNPVANEIHIGGSADATLTNLSEAINGGANPGVDYSSNTTASADVTASAVASHVITLTEKGDGSVPLTLSTNETTYSFSAVTGGIQKVYRGVTATVDASAADSFNYQQLRRHYKEWIES